MAPTTSTLRKAIGAVKDQTTIGLAKVSGTIAPDISVLIVKATSHLHDLPDDKHLRDIVALTSLSRGYVSAAVAALLRRLLKTRDWIVAIKCLSLLHRLLLHPANNGHVFADEIVHVAKGGNKTLNMIGFRDDAHSNSLDHALFVRSFGLFLEEKVQFKASERKSRGADNAFSATTPIPEIKTEKMLVRMSNLVIVLAKIVACRPAGSARSSRLVMAAVYGIVKDSFRVYAEICELSRVVLERFEGMEYAECVKVFDAHVNAVRVIDRLGVFYNWCKAVGIGRLSEFPDIARITAKLLGTLQGYLNDKKSEMGDERVKAGGDEEEVEIFSKVWRLAFETTSPRTSSEPAEEEEPQKELVDLKDEGVNDGITADEEGSKLALFSGDVSSNPTGEWEAFEVTSAWQTPAAESGKADWELALVETASNLSKQKTDLAGGFDPLLLNGMYDQGTVKQHVNTSQLNCGSASSVAMALPSGNGSTPMLALPAPDGTIQAVGYQDPFAASLAVPPPAYVQIADMERKQEMLTQEQLLWQQYGNAGMQGQTSLAKLSGGHGYYGGPQPVMSYAMQQQTGGGTTMLHPFEIGL